MTDKLTNTNQQPAEKKHKPLFAEMIAQHPGLAEELAREDARDVLQGWKLVPSIGTWVKANHPITPLNPEEWFEVYEVRAEDDGRFTVRGKNTCWFGLSMIALEAPPAQEL